MPSPERRGRRAALIALAVRELGFSRAYWATLLLTTLLASFGFRQALVLYGETSRAAADAPGLAPGLRPLDGVLVPTFGALYLSTTLLLPFVAIRLLGGQKQTGSIKLTLQIAASRAELLAAPLAALGLAWALLLVPPLSAVGIWRVLGGHVHPPELLGLLLGHGLYALVVVALAFLASGLTDSAPTAAIFVLAATLGSWVIDFAAQGAGEAGVLVAAASLTRVLRPLEGGLLAVSHVGGWLVTAAALLTAAAVWIHPGLPRGRKLWTTGVVLVGAALLIAAASRLRASWDLTEDRRHSFAPAVEAALSRLSEPLEIAVFLRREDPRAAELERVILSRLRRVVPDLRIQRGDVSGASALGGGAADRYGEVALSYRGRTEVTRSTSPREVLPILWELTGTEPPLADAPSYPGYPLVAEDPLSGPWLYGILPALILAAAAVSYGFPPARR